MTLTRLESDGAIFTNVSPSTLTDCDGFSFHDNLPPMLMNVHCSMDTGMATQQCGGQQPQ
jgi:hypothetical protein